MNITFHIHESNIEFFYCYNCYSYSVYIIVMPIIVMPMIISCYAYLLFSKASSLLIVDDGHDEMHHKTKISCEIRIFICDTFSSIKCAL